MTQDHPITPPLELVQQWHKEWLDSNYIGSDGYIATQAARWGADQELEACCEWIPKATPWDADQLRAARRPKPPTDEGLEPSATQIEQLKSGLDHCFSKASAKEYLRVWVRDYARAVLARWGR